MELFEKQLNGDVNSDVFDLKLIDPTQVENHILRAALERIKERCIPNAHTSYYTKHSSHSRYSKGW